MTSNIERIGDHALNIADDTMKIALIEGQNEYFYKAGVPYGYSGLFLQNKKRFYGKMRQSTNKRGGYLK